MGTDEDYLDRLLHAVTENYREEQGITGEPEESVGDKFVSNPDAVITSTPLTEPKVQPVKQESVAPESVPEPELNNFAEAANEQAPVFVDS